VQREVAERRGLAQREVAEYTKFRAE